MSQGQDRHVRLQHAIDNLVHVVMELREADKGDDAGLCLGELVRQHREGWGLSLSELARAAKCSKGHVWDIERSHSVNPSVDLIANLASALRLPPVQLLNAAMTSQRLGLKESPTRPAGSEAT